MARTRTAPGSDSLERLARDAAGCQACDLYQDATQTVFGRGSATARLLLLGERPDGIDRSEDDGADYDSLSAEEQAVHIRDEDTLTGGERP